jgi:Flp pilus assembly protein CpaB
MRFKVMLILSLVLGFIGVLIIKFHLSNREKLISEAYKPVKLIVASKIIKSGQIITMDHLAYREFPSNYRTNDLIEASMLDQVEGKKALSTIEPGEMIIKSQLASPGRPLLGGTLGADKRLIALRPDSIDKSSGLFKDGEKVDVIVTYNDASDRKTTKTVIQAAVLKKLYDFNSSKDPVNEAPYFLIVSPHQAQLLAHAQNLGKISLSARNASSDERLRLDPVYGDDMNVNVEIISFSH